MSCLCSKIYAMAPPGSGWSFGDGSIVCQECLREYDRRHAVRLAAYVHDFDSSRRECQRCGVDELDHKAADPPGVACVPAKETR